MAETERERWVVIDCEDVRRRVQFGMPLTQDEQRYFVQCALGSLGPVMKRCYACNETGQRGKAIPDGFSDQGQLLYRTCPDCNGRGRILERVRFDVHVKMGDKVISGREQLGWLRGGEGS